MISPLNPLDIFLRPGDCYFADRDTRIRTVLRSYVAITFWHPQLQIGGMSHYVLPWSGSEHRTSGQPKRYAHGAIALLLEEIAFVGAPYEEYQVKLFGGSMFPEADKGRTSQLDIQNVQAARQLVKQYGFICVDEYLGDIRPRKIVFEVWSGNVSITHSDLSLTANYKPLNRNLK